MDIFRTRPLLRFLREKRKTIEGYNGPIIFSLADLKKFDGDCRKYFSTDKKLKVSLGALNTETIGDAPTGQKLSLRDFQYKDDKYRVYITTRSLEQYESWLESIKNRSRIIINENGVVTDNKCRLCCRLSINTRPFKILKLLSENFPQPVSFTTIEKSPSLATGENTLTEKQVYNAIQQLKDRLIRDNFPSNIITIEKKTSWRLNY